MRGNRKYKILDRAAGIPLILAAAAAKNFLAVRRGGNRQSLGDGDSILIVKQSALGDTLLLLPVIKAIRDTIGPDGRVDMLVTPVNQSVAENCPWLSETIHFDPSSVLRAPLKVLNLIRRLRRRRYDATLDFDQWLRSSALLAAMSGATWTAGFRTAGQHRHLAYDAVVDQEKGIHEFQLFSRLAQIAGVEEEKIEPYVGFLRRHGIFTISGPSAPGARKVLLHPGCGSHGWQREWPIGKYAQLGDRLVKEKGTAIEVSGHGIHERSLIDELSSKASFPFIDLGGGLTFSQLATHLSAIKLVVSGNTGVMHLAAGMDVPVVALHGPTDSVKWGPFYGEDQTATAIRSRVIEAKIPCSPCLFLGFEYGCDGRGCMESIDVGEVFEACAELLA